MKNEGTAKSSVRVIGRYPPFIIRRNPAGIFAFMIPARILASQSFVFLTVRYFPEGHIPRRSPLWGGKGLPQRLPPRECVWSLRDAGAQGTPLPAYYHARPSAPPGNRASHNRADRSGRKWQAVLLPISARRERTPSAPHSRRAWDGRPW